MQKLINKFYFYVIAKFIAACVSWARKRERVVQYEIPAFCKYNGEHGSLCPCGVCLGYDSSNVYMTRYVLFGHMTGDGLGAFEGRAARLWVKLKHYLPSVYINCIHRHDHDEAVHNHPWPWAITFGLMGGYDEQRPGPNHYCADGWMPLDTYERRAPFCYLLRRRDWHRIAMATSGFSFSGQRGGVWTLFVAAPRVFSQPWGYLIKGRGYVGQRERHAEIGARETRDEGMRLPLSGRHLDRVAQMYGLERKHYVWFSESDRSLRARCCDIAKRVLSGCGSYYSGDRPAGFTRWQYWGLRLRMQVRRTLGLPLWRKRGVS